MIGVFFGRIVIRPYEVSATNSDLSNRILRIESLPDFPAGFWVY